MDENGVVKMLKMLKKWIGRQRSKRQYARGLNLILQGRQKESLVEFTKIIEENDNFFDAYLGRAIAYLEIERWEDGINDLTYIIDNMPEMAAAYYYRCVGYVGVRKMELALSDINKAISIDPNEPQNYMQRGAIYFWMGKYKSSIEDTTKSIALGFVEDGYNNRAIYFEGMGDYASAIADWSALIDISPKNAIAYYRRGLLWEKVGNLRAAISDIEDGLYHGLPYDLIEASEDMLSRLKNNLKE